MQVISLDSFRASKTARRVAFRILAGAGAAGGSIHQHFMSLQSWAFSDTFSPAFWTSLPAPATVLQAVRLALANMTRMSMANKRFMEPPTAVG